jgi:hypothetical protein
MYLQKVKSKKKDFFFVGVLKVTHELGTLFRRNIAKLLHQTQAFVCPFAVYYLRYAVRPFFTMSRISLADGKRAGQKVQRKIAAVVQKVKSPLLFVPLF